MGLDERRLGVGHKDRVAVISGATANILFVHTFDNQHERDRSRSLENEFWTTPKDIGVAIEYLISDEEGAVNGARLPVYVSQ